MARKIRISFPGAIYHVMARGNERARIFHSAADYELFLKALNEGLMQFGVRLHGYCLMPNHFHLILETPRGNLPRFMAWLQTTFTVRYNRAHRRVGHLFQGRYRAELVEDAAYGKWLLLYVHLNPVRGRRGGVVYYRKDAIKELKSFPWSSHRAYAGLQQSKEKGLSQDWLAEWGQRETTARKRYLDHIQGTIRESDPVDWKLRVEKGLAVGSEAFLEKLGKLLQGRGKETGKAIHSHWKNRERGERLEGILCKERDERVVVWARIRLLGERPADLAREKDFRDGGSILQIVKRLEKRATEDPIIKAKLRELENLSRVDD